jgi:nitrite reductase/ring-hydroxylating ferredoxin subunit
VLNSAQNEDSAEFFALTVGTQHYLVSRRCPHRGGRLDHGVVHDRKRIIVCPLHRSVFSLETGEQLSGPACGRILVVKVTREPTPAGS